MFCNQIYGQNCDIKTADKCFENVAKFRCLVLTVTNQKLYS